MDSVFSELSLVIVVTAVVSIIMRFIKQPLILGYILAGLVVGPTGLNLIHSEELFDSFSEIGITLPVSYTHLLDQTINTKSATTVHW